MRWGQPTLAVVVASLSMLLVAGCESTDGSSFAPGSYKVRESGVNFRAGQAACVDHPGPVNCPTVLRSLQQGQRLFPICQRRGQLVVNNDYWVHAWGPRGAVGWVASWYLDYPANRLPELPDCTPNMIKS